jgi:hypothetical protein
MDKSFSGGLERDALEDALPHPGEHLAGADLHEGGRSGSCMAMTVSRQRPA